MKLNELPLNKKNIVITRSLDSISEVKNLFQEKGANVFDLPSLIIDYPDDLSPLDEALFEINDFHWIIFSSSNGIKFVDRRLREKGTSLRQYSKNLKIAVVGERTSQTLSEFGIEPNFVPPDYMAESLIDNFPISGYGLKIFLPRVQTGGRDIIADQFRNAGARVVEVAAYESRCPKSMPSNTIKAFEERKIDAIVFSSGKTVRNSAFLLKNQFGKEWLKMIDPIKLLTIGPQTSIACKEIFRRIDKEASKFTFLGLVDAAIEIFE